MADLNDLNQFINQHGLEVYTDELMSIVDAKIGQINAGNVSIETYGSTTMFPVIGNGKTIYVERTNKKIYLWDESDLKYYCYSGTGGGGTITDIKKIDGGDAYFTGDE